MKRKDVEKEELERETHQKLSNLEVSPDAQAIVSDDLTEGHPFVVGSDSCVLAVREACSRCAEFAPGRSCVVRV